MRQRGLNINQIISVLTIMVMLWDTFGWFGSNLLLKMHPSDDGLHYCTVSFCMCKIDSPFSVCDCHYSDDAKKEDEPHIHKTDHHKENDFKFSSDNKEKSFCSTKKSKSHKDSAEVLIVWTEYRAFLPGSEIVYGLTGKSVKYSIQKQKIEDGFPPRIEQPPTV